MRLIAEGLLIWSAGALGVIALLICGACAFRLRNGRWPDEAPAGERGFA